MRFPATLGSYTLLKEIGQGGWAAVYLGMKDGSPYAVKCLNADAAAVPAKRESFIREVEIASHLKHPNLQKVTDQGKVGNTLFFVSDLIVGVNLQLAIQDWIEKQARVPLSASLFILKECCNILSYLHHTTVYPNSNSVLFHGDLSPENLLLSQDGSVWLIDFGSAGQETSVDPRQLHQGKISYMPPEVLQRKPVSTTTDVYSLSVIAFYLLFGQKPFDGKTRLEIVENISKNPIPKLPWQNVVKYEKDELHLHRFFEQALHKEASSRFQTVEEFQKGLHKIQFLEKECANASEHSHLFTKATQQRLSKIEKDWKSALDEHKKLAVTSSMDDFQAESLLAHRNRRKHPRLPIKAEGTFAEILSPTDGVIHRFEVHELSPGGLLLKWEGVKPGIGQRYPITLHLDSETFTVKGMAKLLYEVSRDGKVFAAMEMEKLSPTDSQKISEFVAERTQPSLREEEEILGHNYFDVFFQNAADLLQEFERNIRFGGMFLQSESRVSVDEQITIRIQLPDQLRRILLTGRVVSCSALPDDQSSKTKYGIGVQLDVKEDQLKSLFSI